MPGILTVVANAKAGSGQANAVPPLTCPHCHGETLEFVELQTTTSYPSSLSGSISLGGPRPDSQVSVTTRCIVCGSEVSISCFGDVDLHAEMAPYRTQTTRRYWPPNCQLSMQWSASLMMSGGTILPAAPATVSSVAEPPKVVEPLRVQQGSFIGYRAWKIEEWMLGSSTGSHIWDPGINTAKCKKYYGSSEDLHTAPDPDCQCGLYALARFDEESAWWSNADVLGAVEAWSDSEGDGFVLQATGFRAQHARVILLATNDEWPRAKNAAIRALADVYDAQTVKQEFLEDAAKEHGSLVPEDWLEWADPATYKSEHMPTITGSGTRAVISAGSAPAIGYTTMKEKLAARRKQLKVASKPREPRPTLARARRERVSMRTKTNGPPMSGTHKPGDTSLDRSGVVWVCQKAGTPGSWAYMRSRPWGDGATS